MGRDFQGDHAKLEPPIGPFRGKLRGCIKGLLGPSKYLFFALWAR